MVNGKDDLRLAVASMLDKAIPRYLDMEAEIVSMMNKIHQLTTDRQMAMDSGRLSASLNIIAIGRDLLKLTRECHAIKSTLSDARAYLSFINAWANVLCSDPGYTDETLYGYVYMTVEMFIDDRLSMVTPVADLAKLHPLMAHAVRIYAEAHADSFEVCKMKMKTL